MSTPRLAGRPARPPAGTSIDPLGGPVGAASGVHRGLRPVARRAVGPVAVLALAAGLTACAPTVSVDVAPEATDPGCAVVLSALFRADDLAGRDRREVDAQSAAAWGDPPIVLRCGVPVPGPTTDTCINVNGIDWVGRVDVATGEALYTTYGRSPAVEVRVPDSEDGGLDTVLSSLSPSVAQLPRTRECL